MRYFDHNATHPLLAEARDAWLHAIERYPANASSPHRWGGRSDHALEEARQRVATWLGCRTGEVTFTSGATEANNAVLHHLAMETQGEVWVSAIEHPSVLVAARQICGNRIRLMPVDSAGVLDLVWFRAVLKKQRPGAVVLMAVNNETGVIQPWQEVLSFCQESEIPFACDAAQWIGRCPASGLGRATFVSGCAHKFGGPTGVGFLKGPMTMRPWLLGGPQEDGRRAGTENLPGILAMIAAWGLAEEQLAVGADAERKGWRDQFECDLLRRLPDCEILGANQPRLWNTVAALLPVNDCKTRWVVRLDRLGFATSTGSACSSGREKPSYVLLAMGYPPEQAGRMIRFSSGWTTDQADWQALLEGILETAGSMNP